MCAGISTSSPGPRPTRGHRRGERIAAAGGKREVLDAEIVGIARLEAVAFAADAVAEQRPGADHLGEGVDLFLTDDVHGLVLPFNDAGLRPAVRSRGRGRRAPRSRARDRSDPCRPPSRASSSSRLMASRNRCRSAAAVEQREAVADGVGVVDVVGDEDHAEPRARAWATRRSTTAAWCTPSAEVGSSRISTLAPKWTRAGDRHALALAARQRADRLARVADVDADVGHLLARRSRWRASMSKRRNGPQPLHRLAAEEEVARDRSSAGSCARSWKTVAMPRSSASRGEREDAPACRRSGSRRCSARCTPERILISVDLPAPLSPSRQCTSPGQTVDARRPASAMTEPKCLLTSRSSMTGRAVAHRGSPSAPCARM